MSLSSNETWTLLHGMIFGAAYLLAFSGGLAGLYDCRVQWLTLVGAKKETMQMSVGLWAMALIAWATVITGTYVIYPWYRAKPPAGTTDLTDYPRSLLLSSTATQGLHNFGMEWKEHVGWLAPMAATVVAYTVSYYGPALATRVGERKAITIFFVVSFFAAAAAGLFGAMLNKVAPIR